MTFWNPERLFGSFPGTVPLCEPRPAQVGPSPWGDKLPSTLFGPYYAEPWARLQPVNSSIIATMPRHSENDKRCVSCEVRNGLPTAKGKAPAYYVSRHDGRRMLVVARRSGERLRINGPAEVVVLEIHLDLVKFAIECLSDDGVRSHTNT